MTSEADFGVDRSKTSGRRSYCKACDRRRGNSYYHPRRDELYAQRVAAREAAREAELKALEKEHRKRVTAAKKLHAAQVLRQKEFLRSIGVPDLSPEEISERTRRRPSASVPAPFVPSLSVAPGSSLKGSEEPQDGVDDPANANRRTNDGQRQP
jgi:hypothetical protein